MPIYTPVTGEMEKVQTASEFFVVPDEIAHNASLFKSEPQSVDLLFMYPQQLLQSLSSPDSLGIINAVAKIFPQADNSATLTATQGLLDAEQALDKAASADYPNFLQMLFDVGKPELEVLDADSNVWNTEIGSLSDAFFSTGHLDVFDASVGGATTAAVTDSFSVLPF